MEWSSDGYVLAVGWKHGWGIFSVGGRCLVSAFGVEDVIDEAKYVICFVLVPRRHPDKCRITGSRILSCMASRIS